MPTVPIGYLVGVTLVAWWTLFAVAPLRWPRALAFDAIEAFAAWVRSAPANPWTIDSAVS